MYSLQFSVKDAACSMHVLDVESSVGCGKYSELEKLGRTKATAFLEIILVV